MEKRVRSWARGEHLALDQLSKEGANSLLSNCARTPDKDQEQDDNSVVPRSREWNKRWFPIPSGEPEFLRRPETSRGLSGLEDIPRVTSLLI